MRIRIRVGTWLGVLALWGLATAAPQPDIVYLDRHNIKSKKQGLTEPSALTLAADGQGLWTASDDSKRIFYIDLEGELDRQRSFKIDHKNLEGLALHPEGRYLYGVNERSSQIIRFDLETQKTVQRQPLRALQGLPHGFELLFADTNKGLEGITWDTARGTLFLLKEGAPGMLLEISSDLQTLLNYRLLDARQGFVDPQSSDEIDFSGLAYDPDKKALWIVSDRARRVYLYDWADDRVLQDWSLAYEKKGESRSVKKAEGIAFDSVRQRFYIVSDAEARLYIFDLPGPMPGKDHE
ncbi:MAG: hypothetical protein GKR89_15325 [Candidatus Latescibacteria bacterium]|nr:hypothetical protein [Candidatus Latescibacterota bacterium]